MKILIADDDRVLHKLLSLIIGKIGYETESAYNGEEALQMATENEYDFLFIDLNMPKMNGFEVLERLKADPKTSASPVIMLTNLGEKEDAEKGVALGAAGYMVKAHFTPEEIIDKIKEVLS